MAVPERTMTLEEFLRQPEEEPALEYIDGVVTQKVSPGIDHGWFQGWITAQINDYAVPRKLAAAFPEARTTFGEWSPVPDVSIYRWDRIPRDAEGALQSDAFIPPDIAVEVSSPGQSRREMIERLQGFIARGVVIGLLVHRPDRTITRVAAGEPPRVYRGDERVDLDSVLPGFVLTPDALFESARLT
jgi:Uma2 family endonuclease